MDEGMEAIRKRCNELDQVRMDEKALIEQKRQEKMVEATLCVLVGVIILLIVIGLYLTWK